MRRAATLLILSLATACGGADHSPADEAALRAQIRGEVEAELREEARKRQAIAAAVDSVLEEASHERTRVDIENAPARGAAEPLATIVMFSDYQCPFCARGEPTIARLLREHPDEVRIVFRNHPLPFHDHAMDAAEAAMEVYRQGGGVWIALGAE